MAQIHFHAYFYNHARRLRLKKLLRMSVTQIKDRPLPSYALNYFMAGLGLSDPKNAARRNHAHRHRLQIVHEPQKNVLLTRFLFREVASSQPAQAPKTRFEGKTFSFVRKSPLSISEAPGVFCIEQAQKIIGGSKLTLNPSTLRLAHCFGQIGPTQP